MELVFVITILCRELIETMESNIWFSTPFATMANWACHSCGERPTDQGFRARFRECYCGPCCPACGYKRKKDKEWVCEDCHWTVL